MDRQIYRTDELVISHDDLTRLAEEKRISLGMHKDVARAIALNKELCPKTTGRLAFIIWDWVAFIALGVSLYATFVYAWWWFIVGFVAMGLIHRANVSANTSNMTEPAYFDPDYYERIRERGGWMYRIAPEDAAQFVH